MVARIGDLRSRVDFPMSTADVAPASNETTGDGAGFYRFLALSWAEAERCQVELHHPELPLAARRVLSSFSCCLRLTGGRSPRSAPPAAPASSLSLRAIYQMRWLKQYFRVTSG